MAAARAVLVLASIWASGCAGGQEVTPQAVARARRDWERAGLRDYDLEWTSEGLARGHYRVLVRGGKVQRVDSILPGGREVEMHPARPEFYGVDGLFQVIDDELAQLRSDRPFGQPKGTTTVLRFTPDPNLGYPRSYRRDVRGTPQGVAIDVIRLDPRPSEGMPPPQA